MTHLADEFELRPPALLVSRRAIWFWTVRALGAWIVVGGVEAIVLLANSGHLGPGYYAVVAASGGLALAHLVVMPRWRYRVHRYEVTPGVVYTQAGWLNQERRIAPLSRIQTVDSERGPIEQLFGLANVTVTTASAAGPLRIKGLELDVAQRLVADLTARTQQTAGDAT